MHLCEFKASLFLFCKTLSQQNKQANKKVTLVSRSRKGHGAADRGMRGPGKQKGNGNPMCRSEIKTEGRRTMI